jgi:4-hydroxyacetophenone monooxygenase
MDIAFARRAVEQADLNAIRLALLQATGDPEIAAMRVAPMSVRGGAGSNFEVVKEDHETLISKAVDFLLKEAAHYVPSVPTDDQLRELMELAAGGEPLSDEEFKIRKPLPAFDAFPRAAKWRDGPIEIPDGFVVAIIGAGFSGLGMAVQLAILGIPYIIFERRFELGGTWSINTYPDARVDTPSSVYEFSFEKNYPWSEHFARQSEVRSYLEHIARKYGAYEKIRFNHQVKGGTFNPSNSLWEMDVVDAEGTRKTVQANLVVSASGLFSTPRELNVDGIESFRGEVVHSTEWSDKHTAAGKSLAVVGNGSTGVQLLRKVAEEASQVYVFQRTPQWITPRERYGESVSAEDRWLIDTMPYYWNWTRYTGTIPFIDLYPYMVPDREWQASGGQFNRKNDAVRSYLIDYIKSQVDRRSDLIEKLVPDYAPFSRRLIVDNGWYRTLLKDNVELVTTPISQITATGIVTEDGKERPVDMIVTAVGFSVEKYVWPADYVGKDGVRLQDRWKADGARAYLGMMIHGFPNFFVLYGPNSQNVSGGGGTVPTQIEMWTNYVAQLIMLVLEKKCSSVEVRQSAYEEYNKRLDAVASGLIWLVDIHSTARNYYVHSGRLQVNMPWRYQEWHHMLVAPNIEDMTLS